MFGELNGHEFVKDCGGWYVIYVDKLGGGTVGKVYGSGEKWDVTYAHASGRCATISATSGLGDTHADIADMAVMAYGINPNGTLYDADTFETVEVA